MRIFSEWEKAAQAAAEKAKAFNVCQVLRLMEVEEVAIADMEDWCNQARMDYPCLFIANVVKGLP